MYTCHMSDGKVIVCHVGTKLHDVTCLDDDIKYLLIVQVEDTQEIWALNDGKMQTVREVMNFYADCDEGDFITGWVLVKIETGERKSGQAMQHMTTDDVKRMHDLETRDGLSVSEHNELVSLHERDDAEVANYSLRNQ